MKQDLIEIWKNTEYLCDTDFVNETKKSTQNQVVYIEDIDIDNYKCRTYKDTKIIVTNNDTITAGYNAPGKVAIHNFASATNPGGGVIYGSSAQEECICRCTNLMPCLHDSDFVWENFYQYHRDLKSNLYSNRCIFTPDVLIFKDASYSTVTPKQINVITCAAPNLRDVPNNIFNEGSATVKLVLADDELYHVHLQRAKQILKCAIINRCDSIILGAFGCGAFCNNPEIVALAYNEVIQEYKKYFKYIEFAIYCGKDKTNFEMFNRFIQRN